MALPLLLVVYDRRQRNETSGTEPTPQPSIPTVEVDPLHGARGSSPAIIPYWKETPPSLSRLILLCLLIFLIAPILTLLIMTDAPRFTLNTESG